MKTIYEDCIHNEDGSVTIKEIEVVEYDVYFLINKGELIYIGCSSDVIKRVDQHKSVREFDSYFVYESFWEKGKALQCERSCIILLSSFSDVPLQNKLDANKSIFNYRKLIKIKQQ